MRTGMFQVKGMEGNDDVDKVLKTLHHVWGVRRAEVNDITGNARFSFDENAASLEDFKQALIEAGFQVEQVQEAETSRENSLEMRNHHDKGL